MCIRDSIEYYLTNTPTLKALALLLDCRIPPQALDRDLADFALSLIHILFFLHLSRNGGSRRVRSARADQQQGRGAGKKGRETHDDLLKKSV